MRIFQILEISFIAEYALFQTVFQAGETQQPKAPLYYPKKFEYMKKKNDELFDILGDIGDYPHFEMSQDDNKSNDNSDAEENNKDNE